MDNSDLSQNTTTSLCHSESLDPASFSLPADDDTLEPVHWPGPEVRVHSPVYEKNRSVVNPLGQLTSTDGKRVKKAYFRIQLIRGFKKSLRQIPTRKWAKSGIHQLQKETSHENLWKSYYHLYKKEKGNIASSTLTFVCSNTEKTFNNAYCKKFFEPEVVRRIYYSYIDLVFRSDSTPQEYCRKFNLKCCASDSHSSDCIEKWRDVKQFAQYGLFADLDLGAWDGSSWANPTDPDPYQFLA